MGLWSFFWQITEALPLSQRQKINEVHLLIRRRWRWQEIFQLVFVPLLVNGGDAIHLQTVSQIPLAFFFFLT